MSQIGVVRRAKELLDAGRAVESSYVVRKAIDAEEGSPGHYVAWARALMAMGHLEEATRVLDRCPGRGQVAAERDLRRQLLQALIEYYEEIRLMPALLLAYQRYLGLEPADARAWINMGLVYLALPEPLASEAESCFVQATRVSPDNVLAWYNLGVLYFECGEPEEGVQSLQRSLEADADQADTWYYEGMCHLELSQRGWLGRISHQPKALNCFRQALALNPDHEAAAEQLARLSN